MTFFTDVLPDSVGYVPLIRRAKSGALTIFNWFHWPSENDQMVAFTEQYADEDVYISPFLFTPPPGADTGRSVNTRHAKKINVVKAACVYLDGDDLDFEGIKIPPTTFLQSSEGHWQGFWRLSDYEDYTPYDIEALSRGVYLEHSKEGADGCWHLGHIYRVPGTTNTKYDEPFKTTYTTDMGNAVTYKKFAKVYPPIDPALNYEPSEELPGLVPTGPEVLNRLGDSRLLDLFLEDAAALEDRSTKMYMFECLLWEAGCSMDEVYGVIREVSYNKFRQDGRGDLALWKQLWRDHASWKESQAIYEVQKIPTDSRIAIDNLEPDGTGLYWQDLDLLYEEDIVPDDTFIDLYTEWASRTAALSPFEFHIAASLVLLSATLGRYGKILMRHNPERSLNIYIMPLAATTRERKTAAMLRAKSVIRKLTGGEVDEYIVPEDNTAESIAEWCGGKPNGSDVLFIDEFQDLLKQAKRGGYVGGIPAFLTKMYDGAVPGIIRKTGRVKYQPSVPHAMSLYATGITDQAAEGLTVEKIESGFLPRVLVVLSSGVEAPLGDNTMEIYDPNDFELLEEVDEDEELIVAVLRSAIDLWERRQAEIAPLLTDKEDPRLGIGMTNEAMIRYKQFAYDTTWLASTHERYAQYLMPSAIRMNDTTIRIAALLAMTEGKNMVELRHLIKAISLAPIWLSSTEKFIDKILATDFSRLLTTIETYVANQKDGVVSYQKLMGAFRNKFDNPRELKDAIEFGVQAGTLREELMSDKQRIIRYVARR